MTLQPSGADAIALATYRLATRVIHRLPLLTGKAGQSVAGRRGAAERWVRWAHGARGTAPLLWVHAASVGEALAVEPVLARLRAANRDLRVVHTFSSPSVTPWPRSPHVIHRDFVPLDEARQVAAVLTALRPTLLVFSRGDLWPELVLAAARHGVPVAVAGGMIRPGSARLRTPVARLLRTVSRQVAWLGAAGEAHAERWRRLGVPPRRVEVTGDPRHTHVVERVPDFAGLSPVFEWAARGHVLVAGSVHRSDIAVVLEAASRILHRYEQARILLVPHDPTTAALRGIGAAAARAGVPCGFWEPEGGALPRDRCVAVGGVGRLADLYAVAAIAYVGGGFRPGRLHAVIEPAAWGVPVVVGPATDGDDMVDALVRVGGAVRLSGSDPLSALVARWGSWVEQPTAAADSGLAARKALRPEAASRTAARLSTLLRAPRPLHT